MPFEEKWFTYPATAPGPPAFAVELTLTVQALVERAVAVLDQLVPGRNALPRLIGDGTAVYTRRHNWHRVNTEPPMPLNIRNEAVNQLAEKLAARRHVNKTDAVRMALENELRRLDEAVPLRERVRFLQDRVLSRPTTGLEADKAFYDELSGNA